MENNLKLLLRIIGSVSLLAIIFVVVPYSWMNEIHSALGMGELSNTPVVGYLARSTSAFYAILGALLLVISRDLKLYRNLIVFLGYVFSIFGVILTFIDWYEGMPFYWKVWEGPFVAVLGLLIIYLSRGIKTGTKSN